MCALLSQSLWGRFVDHIQDPGAELGWSSLPAELQGHVLEHARPEASLLQVGKDFRALVVQHASRLVLPLNASTTSSGNAAAALCDLLRTRNAKRPLALALDLNSSSSEQMSQVLRAASQGLRSSQAAVWSL